MCSCSIHVFAFVGQNAEKKDFPVKCCLLAFNIVALGTVVSLELFVSRANVGLLSRISYLPTSGFFFGEAVALLCFTSRKLHVSVERFLCFFHQLG